MDGYYAFMLVATALVLMMTVPALALFYGGMSRSKSVLNMMMMSYVAAAIVGILYVAVGWSMGFGGEGTFFHDPFDLFWLDVTAASSVELGDDGQHLRIAKWRAGGTETVVERR